MPSPSARSCVWPEGRGKAGPEWRLRGPGALQGGPGGAGLMNRVSSRSRSARAVGLRARYRPVLRIRLMPAVTLMHKASYWTR